MYFASVHLHGKGFYPGTGFELAGQEQFKPGGIYNFPIFPGTAKASTWRKSFSDKIVPALCKFKPDFIFVSAGFDAHEKDHLHDSSDTRVTEFEYQWVTEMLMKVANTYCQGRIVSVLEGGYSTRSGPLSPLA